MTEEQYVWGGDIIVAQLRRAPVLRPYPNQRGATSTQGVSGGVAAEEGATVTDSAAAKTTSSTCSTTATTAATTRGKQTPEREPLLSFQARWGKEEEHRLQESLKTQLEFQEVMKSLSGLGGNFAPVTSSDSIKANIVSNSGAAENFIGYHEELSIKDYSNTGEGVVIPLIPEDSPSTATWQEELELRDRMIERLQKELNETRTLYENELARVEEFHRRSKREADAEITELKEQIRQLVADAATMASVQRDEGGDTMTFLKTLNFKESLLQEMHGAFQKASEEWKSDAERSVMSIRVHAEGELARIVNCCENLLLQLEKSSEGLNKSREGDVLSVTKGVAQRVMEDEAAFLASYESRLREHVHSTVKHAVRSRIKDVVRPLVEQELSERRKLYMPEGTSSPSSPTPAVPTVEGSEARVKRAPMTESRRGGAVSLFQHLLPQREIRTPSQQRGSSANTFGGASTVMSGPPHSTTLHRSPHDASDRPHWLDRYCY